VIEDIKGDGVSGVAEDPMDEDDVEGLDEDEVRNNCIHPLTVHPIAFQHVPMTALLTNHTQKPMAKTKAKAAPKAKAPAKANTKAKAAPAAKASSGGSGPEFLEGKKVIITGTIPGHDRKSAQAILEDAGAEFAKSLNKQVELVILGIKAGPDKMAKIEELGVETIEWSKVAEALGLEVEPEKEVPHVEAGSAPDSVEGMTLLITGEIDGHTRASAQKILEAQGAKFAKSLNKSVELVVLGANAGPEKLSKMADQGTDTCSWDDLIAKLGIAAEASEPPKKKAKKV
jgi:NAD-dependent DNA ligase